MWSECRSKLQEGRWRCELLDSWRWYLLVSDHSQPNKVTPTSSYVNGTNNITRGINLAFEDYPNTFLMKTCQVAECKQSLLYAMCIGRCILGPRNSYRGASIRGALVATQNVTPLLGYRLPHNRCGRIFEWAIATQFRSPLTTIPILCRRLVFLFFL